MDEGRGLHFFGGLTVQVRRSQLAKLVVDYGHQFVLSLGIAVTPAQQ